MEKETLQKKKTISAPLMHILNWYLCESGMPIFLYMEGRLTIPFIYFRKERNFFDKFWKDSSKLLLFTFTRKGLEPPIPYWSSLSSPPLVI